jgi:phage tail-like protein
MRGTTTDLPTPYPLAGLLPAFMQEDGFTIRLTEAFDALLAPAIAVLDCLDAYVDPRLAPEDFLPWLADWVGAADDDLWPDERRREGILAAVSLHQLRGTVDGLREHLRLVTGGDVEIDGTGDTTWSLRPTEDDGAAPPGLAIRVYVDEPASLRLAALELVVDAAKPAHLPHRIEVMSR